ncbi:MAG: ribbon-helix-helix domain-containing protein [Euryarchaeota archaeon]|nr:ribbon-helix-helix domain-containing protein [Euryarchaeota archaeon]
MEIIVTVRLPKAIVDRIDDMIDKGVFMNRSDAMRAAARGLLEASPSPMDNMAAITTAGANYLACKIRRPSGFEEDQAIYCPAHQVILPFKNCKGCSII